MSAPTKTKELPLRACELSDLISKITNRNNYLEWILFLIDFLGPIYGDLANVLKTHVAYEVAALVAADYTPEDADGFSPANLMTIRIAAIVARNKVIGDLKVEKTKFYMAIFATIGLRSRTLIKADTAFAAASLANDPNALLAIVRRTHFTHVAGGNPASIIEDLEETFNKLMQGPTQSVSEFKAEFDTQLETLASTDATVFSQERLALKFLKKLDPVRHGRMVSQLNNNQMAGMPGFPTTVQQAYNLAKDWKSDVRLTDSRGAVSTGAAFILADDMRVLIAPVKKLAPKTPRASSSAATSTNGALPVPTVSAYVETRSCHHCNQVGHLRRNCPHREKPLTEKALLAVGDEVDEDALYEASMIYGAAYMTHESGVSAADELSAYGSTVVVLDHASSLSLFHNADLLGALTDRLVPINVGGVQKNGEGIQVESEGEFLDLGVVGYAPGATANILSAGQMVDTGRPFTYDPEGDAFTLKGLARSYVFARRERRDGSKSRFYTCDFAIDGTVLVATVTDNLRRYTAREVKQMGQAEQLMQRLGHMTSAATVSLLNAGVQNCAVTATDVRNKDAAKGVSVAGLMGKTKKRQSVSPGYIIAPRVTQVQQILHIDIIFVKKVPFLLGVLTPLGLTLIEYLRDRSEVAVAVAVELFLSKAASRSFDVLEVRCDGEAAVAAMVPSLESLGLRVLIAGPGQHVHVVERMSQTVKGRQRCHELALPFVMPLLLIVWCMRFCVHCVNLQPNANSTDKVSPYEQFSGIKLDVKRDLRVAFGDYILATPPDTDNSMRPRVEACIALGGKNNLAGSVWAYNLRTGHVVTRDQFVINPMPDAVIQRLTAQALRQGYTRGVDPTLEVPPVLEELDQQQLPDMMQIDGRADAAGVEDLLPAMPTAVAADDAHAPPAAGVMMEAVASNPVTANAAASPAAEAAPNPEQDGVHQLPDNIFEQFGVRWSQRLRPGPEMNVLLTRVTNDATRREVRRQLELRGQWRDTAFAFKISVRAALRERGEEARPVIMAELQQMVDKRVWHGVHCRNLSPEERRAIIRSSMFLKDKYLASGAFEKFKARLVAGGDQQDKGLYENLSSPTAATTSVLCVAAIAAAEGRAVMVMDIGGAFLNADISNTGIKVHMRLDRVLTAMLATIAPEHAAFVEADGTSVVRLDKALYGCVEAAALWHADLSAALVRGGFAPNPYDPCVFNKLGSDGKQITVVVHVDDLHVSCATQFTLDEFETYMLGEYREIKVNKGRVVDYLGMTFDYRVPGQVTITMDNCVDEILSGCGVTTTRMTPAAETLFDTRSDAIKATAEEERYFRTYVAKILYLSKRIKPECLVAVAFLTTRVNDLDVDDLAKLRRLLGYLRATRDRGIVLRIGDSMTVRAYIDAAYGVHQSSGKSHTGCAIVLGDGGTLSARSAKQKIVTKSSTEAELVGLSDCAAEAIHLRNFVHAQGYEVGPAIIYQDNLSCMALMKRGGPGSERSRHINIRHFWVAERVDAGEVVIEHLSTDEMFANALTKPVQGAQFVRERLGLTNWV